MVDGASIGKMTYAGQACEEHMKCKVTDWVSNTLVMCMVGQDVQRLRRTVVMVGNSSGSVT